MRPGPTRWTGAAGQAPANLRAAPRGVRVTLQHGLEGIVIGRLENRVATDVVTGARRPDRLKRGSEVDDGLASLPCPGHPRGHTRLGGLGVVCRHLMVLGRLSANLASALEPEAPGPPSRTPRPKGVEA